jgi:hypothetical protein
MKSLIKTLIERKLVKADAVLTGLVQATSLGGVIKKIRKEVYCTGITNQGFAARDESGFQFVMQFDDLESIDGMDLPRYARVYNIKPDGGTAKTGKKRGRKPKVVINTLEA